VIEGQDILNRFLADFSTKINQGFVFFLERIPLGSDSLTDIRNEKPPTLRSWQNRDLPVI